MKPCLLRSAAFIAGLAPSLAANAQSGADYRVQNASIQEQANGVLALMAFSVVPDLNTSALSITNASSGNPGLRMIQFGGGFTWSKATPLYLEGALGFSHYDPTFVVSNGRSAESVPAKWTSFSGTGGIGWDFPLTDNLKLRPILDFTLGYVTSNILLGNWDRQAKSGADLRFLGEGTLQAAGIGGALMLDYEHYRDDGEVDVELRYTDIRLQSIGGSQAVQGHAKAQTASAWARWRAPTGLTALQRPLRYVLEGAHSAYLGSQAGALGFNRLSSLGAGLEFDSSAYDAYVTRTRLIVRHAFGENISGYSLSIAMSF